MALSLRPIDLEALREGSNLFQGSYWGRFKALHGWSPHAFSFSWRPAGGEASRRGELLVLARPVGEEEGVAYVPLGPDLAVPPTVQGVLLEALAAQLASLLPPRCVFIRFDLPWESPYAAEAEADRAAAADRRAKDQRAAEGEAGRGRVSGDPRPRPRIREVRMNFGTRHWNLRKAPTDLLPPDTVIVDLRGSDEELLGRMRPRARYNVRMSGRRGVSVQEADLGQLATWYRLYRSTTRRQALVDHPLAYFRGFFDVAGEADRGVRMHLLLAQVAGSAAAGLILAIHRRQAYYLFGASSRRYSGLAPSHRLVWQALRLARAQGCLRCDLCGIPPSDLPSHPMHGLYRFKTGFGGRVLHRRGCWDYPLDLERYLRYRGAELGAAGYHLR